MNTACFANSLLCSHRPSWHLCLAQSSSGVTSSRKLFLTNSSLACYHNDFLGGSEGQTEKSHAEQMEMKCPFSRTWSIVFLLFKDLPPLQHDQQSKSSHPGTLCLSSDHTDQSSPASRPRLWIPKRWTVSSLNVAYGIEGGLNTVLKNWTHSHRFIILN